MSAPTETKETLVVATTNRHKLAELKSLLAALPLDVRSVAEVTRDPPHVVEDGTTFIENAIKKARAVADATMLLTLADDSGLEVDALDGRPGVRSARFAHERATDAENNVALLAALESAGDPGASGSSVAFGARFRCALALVDPFTNGGEPRTVEGVCEGAIIRTPRGVGGFGYDPLFVVAQIGKTMGELSDDEKNRVSHRARAFVAMRPLIAQVLLERAAQTARLEEREEER